MSGEDLASAPDRGVRAGHGANLAHARAVRCKEQRHQPPSEGVVEVVDESGLRAGP